MKKILFIDPLSQYGHVNFNKNYIKELRYRKFKIDFVFKEGYEKNFSIKKNILNIPKKLFVESNRLISIYHEILKLRYINNNLDLNKYDYIFLSSYNEIGIYFSGIKSKLILINHNNLQGLDNSLKLFFYKKISRNNCQIVFENYMKKYLESIGVTNVFKISHGFSERMINFNNNHIYKNKLASLKFGDFNKVIFISSVNKLDKKFFQELILDEKFITYLKDKNCLLVIKSKLNLLCNSRNIRLINYVLTDFEYNSIFMRSDLIIIKYPDFFKRRVSAVFFECVNNNKTCLIYKTETFLNYKNLINYDPYFNSKNELIEKISINLNLNMPTKFTISMNIRSDFTNFFNQY